MQVTLILEALRRQMVRRTGRSASDAGEWITLLMVIRAICLRQMIAEVLKVGGSTRTFSAIFKDGSDAWHRKSPREQSFKIRAAHLPTDPSPDEENVFGSVTLVSKAFIDAR
jgi:hypothetical protein